MSDEQIYGVTGLPFRVETRSVSLCCAFTSISLRSRAYVVISRVYACADCSRQFFFSLRQARMGLVALFFGTSSAAIGKGSGGLSARHCDLSTFSDGCVLSKAR